MYQFIALLVSCALLYNSLQEGNWLNKGGASNNAEEISCDLENAELNELRRIIEEGYDFHKGYVYFTGSELKSCDLHLLACGLRKMGLNASVVNVRVLSRLSYETMSYKILQTNDTDDNPQNYRSYKYHEMHIPIKEDDPLMEIGGLPPYPINSDRVISIIKVDMRWPLPPRL